MADFLSELQETVRERRDSADEKSYTAYLFEQGLDKMLKKVAEESGEVIIAAKNAAAAGAREKDKSEEELIGELADLFYHLVVLMEERGVAVNEVAEELSKRHQKSGNKKNFHQVDKNS